MIVDGVRIRSSRGYLKGYMDYYLDIHYHYIYPRDLEDVSSQVSHSAPTNIDGYKPCQRFFLDWIQKI